MKKSKNTNKIWQEYFLLSATSPLLFSLLSALVWTIVLKFFLLLLNNEDANNIMRYFTLDSAPIFACITAIHFIIVMVVRKMYISIPPGYSLFSSRRIRCFSLDDDNKLIEFDAPIWHKSRKQLYIKTPRPNFSQETSCKNFCTVAYLKYQDFHVAIKLPILLKFQADLDSPQIIEILKSDFQGGSIKNYMDHLFHKSQNKKAIAEAMERIRKEMLENKPSHFNASLMEFTQEFLDSLKHFIKHPEENEMFPHITMHIQQPFIDALTSPDIVEGK